MGGAIGIGIRRRSGETILVDDWTNGIPFLLCMPEFFNDGTEVDRYFAEAKPTNEWPYPKKIETLEPSEYGILLVDFMTREIFSRQDYCRPGQFLVSSISSNYEEEKQIAEYLQKNKMGRIKKERGFSSLAYFRLAPTVYKIDHKSVRAYENWKEVQAWLHKHGWTVPTVTQDEVDRRWAA